MDHEAARANLDRLIAERGENYGALSRMLGRNPAYIQQYIRRGSPRKLDENDRRMLARYFGVDEAMLGGEDRSAPSVAAGRGARRMVDVPRLALGASAGAGALDVEERVTGAVSFDPDWIRAIGVRGGELSIIRVAGESMEPTLADGDDIMVDRGDGAERLREGIYVLRFEDALMVKRISPGPGRGQLSILSDNPHHRSWHDRSLAEVDIVGRVVWKGARVR